MKIMRCPLDGPRNISEFVHGGEVRDMPDPGTDLDWAAWVFKPEDRMGVVREWWFHLPCGSWFVAERDTRTDEILRFPDPGAVRDRR